jgi:molybdate transport system substrate-binding protein
VRKLHLTQPAVGRAAAISAGFVTAFVLTGCAASTGSEAIPAPADGPLAGTISVFAAASLTDTFQQIADDFEKAHPGVTVTLNFGGSSSQSTQITEGAPADVFAAASSSTMEMVGELAKKPIVFATNSLEIATPVDNPGSIENLRDFANPDLSIALCAVEVPCGAAAQTVLGRAGIIASVDTYEQDVKAVLTKVELGEVDAGLVYTTDVLAAGDKVNGIEFAESSAAVNTYPIATLSGSTNADAAAQFVAFVLSDAGQGIFRAAGFGAP